MRPRESTADYIARQTMIYWCISAHRNGAMVLPPQVEQKLTVSSALRLCGNLLETTNPARPLSKRVYHLQQAIIKGGKRARASDSTSAKLLPFESKPLKTA